MADCVEACVQELILELQACLVVDHGGVVDEAGVEPAHFPGRRRGAPPLSYSPVNEDYSSIWRSARRRL